MRRACPQKQTSAYTGRANTEMKEPGSSFLTASIVFALLLTLVGYQWPSLWLVYLFKPLATLLLILLAFLGWKSCRTAASRWIVVGLVLSFIGDVLLIWPNQYFLPGLVAFLLTHIAYLVAFTRDCNFPARFMVWLAYLAIAVGFYVFLLPTVPSGLRIPVAIYAAFLSTMAGQAMGRFFALKNASAQSAAIGALLFLISDLLLAFHHFRQPLLYATILILLPYYLGQWLIASSIWSTRRVAGPP